MKLVKLILFVAGLILLVQGVAVDRVLAEDAPKSVTIDKIKNTNKPIKFPHQEHLPKFKGLCGTCHTNKAGGGPLKPELFKTYERVAEGMHNAYHEICLDCHKKSEGENIPTRCDDCHR